MAVTVSTCLEYAKQCLDHAERIGAPEKREALLTMAELWLTTADDIFRNEHKSKSDAPRSASAAKHG